MFNSPFFIATVQTAFPIKRAYASQNKALIHQALVGKAVIAIHTDYQMI